MTDQELSAKLAEAVRPVWDDLRIIYGRHKMFYVPDESAWQLMCGDDDCAWVFGRWAAAILLHELERYHSTDDAGRPLYKASTFVAINAVKELLNEA